MRAVLFAHSGPDSSTLAVNDSFIDEFRGSMAALGVEVEPECAGSSLFSVRVPWPDLREILDGWCEVWE